MSTNNQTNGHHATSGGLRGHSTGALYPAGVQGRVILGNTYWQAWNLETGRTDPRLFSNYNRAAAVALQLRGV